MAANMSAWCGPARRYFPDFTRAQTRDWWGGLYKEFVQNGVAGFWNDMNEPAVFDGPGKTMPLDNIHRIEEPGFATRTATHSEIHNVVDWRMRAPPTRVCSSCAPMSVPLCSRVPLSPAAALTDLPGPGTIRDLGMHLRSCHPAILNLRPQRNLIVGDDIGGFNGSPPSDLLTRWIEIGAFNPLFRDHTTQRL